MTSEKPPTPPLFSKDAQIKPYPALDYNPFNSYPQRNPSPAPSPRPSRAPYVVNAAVHFLLFLAASLFPPAAPRWFVVSKGFGQAFLGDENATIPQFIFLFSSFSNFPHNKTPLHLFFTVDWRFLAMEWGLIIASFGFVWYLLRLRRP